MSQKVNIPRTIQDPNYRYQMPALQTRIEGKGINIHTTLLNLGPVAKSMRISKEYILKFFGYELSIQVNEKGAEIYLNGEIPEDDVLKVLDKFIDKYILCAKCGVPEMFISSNAEKTALTGHCYVCGFTTQIDKVHKLSGYILKNPPQNQSEFKKHDADKSQFETSTVADGEKGGERRGLILKIRANAFIPQSEESKELFEEVEAYLTAGFPVSKDYVFDLSHVEVVYKLIKRLRLEKEKRDRIGYILFRHIFDVESVKNLTDRPVLFQRVLRRHNMGSFVSQELLLNLQWMYYEENKETDHSKIIPTRLAKLMESEFLEEVI